MTKILRIIGIVVGAIMAVRAHLAAGECGLAGVVGEADAA